MKNGGMKSIPIQEDSAIRIRLWGTCREPWNCAIQARGLEPGFSVVLYLIGGLPASQGVGFKKRVATRVERGWNGLPGKDKGGRRGYTICPLWDSERGYSSEEGGGNHKAGRNDRKLHRG